MEWSDDVVLYIYKRGRQEDSIQNDYLERVFQTTLPLFLDYMTLHAQDKHIIWYIVKGSPF